ncbi:MAG: zinc-binding dehydrogenase [Ignavibacteria bacterium]|nr:zinc-binding dehydrogenase [Ignavibacteria bacterium]
MKAALLKQTGNAGDMKKNLVIEDIPVPEITDNQVLINIKFASLNHRDLWIAKGAYSKIRLPVVLGSDGAGIIHSKGSKVTSFEIGDEVIMNPGFNWGDNENYQSKDFKILGMPDNGTLAEYVAVNKSYVYKKPVHLDLMQSSAIPLTGITAYCALFKKLKLSRNDTLLITGIGGGVSTFALVYALSLGVTVFVTSSSDDKIQKAISLGAKGGVNYTNENWDKEMIELSGNKINTVIDGAGSDTFLKCIDIINYGGRIVCYGATNGNVINFPMARLFWKQLKIFGSTMGPPGDFSEMMKFINDHKVIPVIDKVFKLEDISKAFERMNETKAVWEDSN